MRIRISDNGGKTCDRYTVLIGRHYWNMSADADRPNGVCMYAGYSDGAWLGPDDKELTGRDLVPVGVLRQAVMLAEDVRREAKAVGGAE